MDSTVNFADSVESIFYTFIVTGLLGLDLDKVLFFVSSVFSRTFANEDANYGKYYDDRGPFKIQKSDTKINFSVPG